jgi:TonB family protein
MSALSRISLAAGLLCLAGVGPAHAQVVRARDAQGREVERRCQPAQWPKKLPALGAVLDSTALFAALATLPEGDTTTIVLSVLYQDGKPSRVRLVQPDVATLPPATTIVEAASAALRPLAPTPPGPYAAVRVRLTGGAPKSAIVEQSVFCPPEAAPATAGRGEQRVLVTVVSPGGRVPTGAGMSGRGSRMDAEVTIDATGVVNDVRILTGSGFREVDDEFVRELRQRVYFPAMLDGVAIPGWVRTNGTRMRL